MIRDIFLIEFRDVADQRMGAVKVFYIGLIGVGIPLACENTMAASFFKPKSHTADAGEEINKRERCGTWF